MTENQTVSADERARQVAEAHAELLTRGYVDIDEHRGLYVGARVRHRGERYPAASFAGTGVIRTLTEKKRSSWSRSWGQPDVELVVECDQPRIGTAVVGRWADYHTALVEIVHATPVPGSGLMPCCGRVPSELSRSERLTSGDGLYMVGCRWPEGRDAALDAWRTLHDGAGEPPATPPRTLHESGEVPPLDCELMCCPAARPHGVGAPGCSVQP